jgi:uncharacterized membrane protein YcaP (DUF421 family)
MIMSFIEATIRTIATFLTLFIMCRILGKKLIAQMTFFDYIAGITIGSLGASFVFSQAIPNPIGMYGIVLFGILVLITDILSIKVYRTRKIFNGEPLLIIKNGKILEEGMEKARLTMDDLLFLLRKKNIFYLDEVDFAFLETDGTISAQKKGSQQYTKNVDLKITPSSRGIPQTFIIDGKVMKGSLQAAGKDENWIKNTLQYSGINNVMDVAIAQVDEKGTVFIDQRADKH